MKKLIPVVLSLVCTSAFAGAFDQFLTGLQKDYFFTNKERGIELTNHVRVAKFGLLGRVMSPQAIATYNGNLNVINLDEKLLEGKAIKDARIIRGPDFMGTYHLSTIFHEMGHAELDVFIERRREPADQMVYSHYENVLKPFYKKNFKGFNSKTIFHEHFGYYRSDLIDLLTNEVGDVLLANGFNRTKRSCFLTQDLRKKLAAGMELEDFKKFHLVGISTPYSAKISPRYVYVRGKDIDLYSVPSGKEISAATGNIFWAYHQEMYDFPNSQADLVGRMNKQSDYLKDLINCRTKFWNDHQNSL